ncbi:MAG: hypothetical protein J6I66_00810 [Lachnospiraceae bacterium]|nr:hypothetical protein [Lachnospiraceae bacterium]
MDDDKRMVDEYKSHFKAMIPSLAWLFCVLMMGFVLWDIAFSEIVYPLQREKDYINQSRYSYVVESSNDYGNYSRLKKLDNIITFTNDQGKRLNVNTYIPVETAVLGEWNLQENEIAVSQKLADKLGLSVGSMISADYPVYDLPMEYEVKVILPYASDLYNSMDSQDFSYAVVGDDGVLLNQAKGIWTYFLNTQEYEEYYERNNSYINRFDLTEEKENLSIKIMVRYVALVVIMLALVITVAVLMHKEINREVLKYYYDGYGIHHVKRIDRKDHFFFYGIPCVVQIIWVAFLIRKAEYPIAFFLCVFVILVSMLFITMFVGGRKYGKAN